MVMMIEMEHENDKFRSIHFHAFMYGRAYLKWCSISLTLCGVTRGKHIELNGNNQHLINFQFDQLKCNRTYIFVLFARFFLTL